MKLRLFVIVVMFFVVSIAPLHAAEKLVNENLLQSLPEGYKQGFSNRQGNRLIIEMVPEAESVESWTEMVTTLIFFGGVPQRTPQAFYTASGASWKKVCGNAESRLINQGTENGYPFAFWLQRCPLNPRTNQEEFTLFKAIQGNDSFYVVQKAWKVSPEKGDFVAWSQYFSRVMVCDSRIKGRACPSVK